MCTSIKTSFKTFLTSFKTFLTTNIIESATQSEDREQEWRTLLKDYVSKDLIVGEREWEREMERRGNFGTYGREKKGRENN